MLFRSDGGESLTYRFGDHAVQHVIRHGSELILGEIKGNPEWLKNVRHTAKIIGAEK